MEKIKVEIWSDIVCPFCYIGKRKFEEAVSRLDLADKLEIEWKSFQLDPSTVPNSSVDIYDYLAQKYGKDRAWSLEMHDSVVAQAKAVGLDYNFEKTTITNTLKAHQLAHLAKTIGKGEAIEEALFKAYFTEGKNLNQTETLIHIGEEVGLSKDDIVYHLEKQTYFPQVQKDIQEAQEIGVRGVPFFVFNRKYAVSGAQNPSVFEDTLKELMKGD
ncbi:MAG: DsbA family oxidoreductase [Flavobacteriia bacterium]|jgi:predicted DsbA family dithiol-disulfide isomerase